ncbi:MAG: hypothetical protein HGA43_08100 [Nitrospirae bacterium]|nr:hypothetical protein [Nitrospirota bacterium]
MAIDESSFPACGRQGKIIKRFETAGSSLLFSTQRACATVRLLQPIDHHETPDGMTI